MSEASFAGLGSQPDRRRLSSHVVNVPVHPWPGAPVYNLSVKPDADHGSADARSCTGYGNETWPDCSRHNFFKILFSHGEPLSLTRVLSTYLAPGGLVLVSLVVLFLSAWILLPTLHPSLLAFGVGSPEVAPWLCVSSLLCLGAVLFFPSLPAFAWRGVLLMSALSYVLSLVPLVQVRGLIAGVDQQVDAEFPLMHREAGGRISPVSWHDHFFGIAVPPVREETGIPVSQQGDVKLTLNLYRPPKQGRYPLVVSIYGGAWQRGDPSQSADFSRYLASRGYVVASIDYRHAPAFRWPAQIDDVRQAFRFIMRHPEWEFDPQKVVVMGRSAGAHLAMMLAYAPDAPAIRGVIDFYGPVDLAEGYANPPSPDPLAVRDVLRAFLGGTPESVPQAYRDASPSSYIDRALPPTLILQGGRDHIVLARFSRELHNRLLATGTRSVLIELPWSEHAFDAVFRGLGNQIALYYVERFIAWTTN